MKKIIAIGASNSKNSINKQFAHWAAGQLDNSEVEVVDLSKIELPLYSIDIEQASGIPQAALDLKVKIKEADALIFSFAEHNGNYSAAFKNVMDWISRIEKGIWANKPTLLLSTSPGGRGGKTVLGIAEAAFPRLGAQVAGSFSLPTFAQNFTQEEGITDSGLREDFDEQLRRLQGIL